jgi:hypothetical protein
VNGAGKTTQLQIVMGRLQPDGGEIIKAKRHMKIAYLAQVRGAARHSTFCYVHILCVYQTLVCCWHVHGGVVQLVWLCCAAAAQEVAVVPQFGVESTLNPAPPAGECLGTIVAGIDHHHHHHPLFPCQLCRTHRNLMSSPRVRCVRSFTACMRSSRSWLRSRHG